MTHAPSHKHGVRLLAILKHNNIILWDDRDLGAISNPKINISPAQIPEHRLLAALKYNQIILWGNQDLCKKRLTTPRASFPVPDSLEPTPLQMTKAHHPLIDGFPFPRMRDNMIILSELFDIEAFCNDLLANLGFYVRTGCPTWDQQAWRIDGEFSNRWGYLLL